MTTPTTPPSPADAAVSALTALLDDIATRETALAAERDKAERALAALHPLDETPIPAKEPTRPSPPPALDEVQVPAPKRKPRAPKPVKEPDVKPVKRARKPKPPKPAPLMVPGTQMCVPTRESLLKSFTHYVDNPMLVTYRDEAQAFMEVLGDAEVSDEVRIKAYSFKERMNSALTRSRKTGVPPVHRPIPGVPKPHKTPTERAREADPTCLAGLEGRMHPANSAPRLLDSRHAALLARPDVSEQEKADVARTAAVFERAKAGGDREATGLAKAEFVGALNAVTDRLQGERKEAAESSQSPDPDRLQGERKEAAESPQSDNPPPNPVEAAGEPVSGVSEGNPGRGLGTGATAREVRERLDEYVARGDLSAEEKNEVHCALNDLATSAPGEDLDDAVNAARKVANRIRDKRIKGRAPEPAPVPVPVGDPAPDLVTRIERLLREDALTDDERQDLAESLAELRAAGDDRAEAESAEMFARSVVDSTRTRLIRDGEILASQHL